MEKFKVSLFSSEAPLGPGPRPRGRPHPRPSRIQSEINLRSSQSSLLSPAHGSRKRLYQQKKVEWNYRIICTPGSQGDCFVSGDHRCPKSGYHSSSS